MKRLVAYFINGLLLVAPTFVILYVLFSFFKIVDGFLEEYIKSWLGFFQPGIGILIIILMLTFLGYFAETALIKPIKLFLFKIIEKVPVVNYIFTSLNDLFKAFAGKEKKFNIPVSVLINKENDLWKLGFLTKDSLDELNLDGKVAVYFPHSYNFSGELYLVPVTQVKKLDVSPGNVMKFIVSGGVSGITNEMN